MSATVSVRDRDLVSVDGIDRLLARTDLSPVNQRLQSAIADVRPLLQSVAGVH